MTSYRIGIDVGGTFTHAVALEATTLELSAQAKVPTTHRAERGVAEGVVQVLRLLLDESSIRPADITFVAYSTTQVTNALLEGDVAPVGIVAVGSGLEGRRAQSETRIGDLALAPGRRLRTFHTYLQRDQLDESAAAAAVAELARDGAEAMVAAEAFSVDDPSGERLIIAAAQAAGLPASGTHEISGLYGLRIRTRTAVINASLLPKTIATADLTEVATREAGITAPLMVVRSDGGVMSVADLRRRPLLALLSGPAAGVAAALMYVRVTDGIFFEVGGTSTDITAIQHGRALLRTAEVGGHRLFLRMLDVRTIGVAGGSMPRVRGGAVVAVGPRSAHLAGMPYACFSDPDDLKRGGGPQSILLAPVGGDPAEYAALETAGGRVALTVTCAANAAGQVPAGDWACGDRESARIGLGALGNLLGQPPEAAAAAVLAAASEQAARAVEVLLADRGVSRDTAELIAGGGGAAALAPPVAERLGLPMRIAPNAPVVSAIGTALAVVRDVVERTVPDLTEAQMLEVRRQAAEAAVRAGADPDSVTVDIEYDARTAVLRAIATGQTELRERDLARRALATDEERLAAAANSMRVAPQQVEMVADSGLLRAYRGRPEPTRGGRGFLGLKSRSRELLAVVDQHAVVRLLLPRGVVASAPANGAREAVAELLDECTRYGDAGAELPQLFLGVRARMVDLSGLVNAVQVMALAEAEIAGLGEEERLLLLAAPRTA
jgi:N-methylhydantoinase A/oxoprolinase/acetone carboxylase beta subunit